MDQAVEIALAQIVGALHSRGRIDSDDVAAIVEGLRNVADRRSPSIFEPLNHLADRIEQTAS